MNFRSSLRVCASLLALAAPLAAQTTTKLKLTAPAIFPGGETTSAGYFPSTAGNFYLSPYAGILNYGMAGQQNVILNCVDFFHDVNLGDVWEVKVTNLGAAAAGTQVMSYTRGGASALDLYKQAAWLTLQYDFPNPGIDKLQTAAIQGAIWNLFNTTAPDAIYTGPVQEYSQAWWISQSVAGLSAAFAPKLQYFSILSDDHKVPVGSDRQEFLIYSTPEPATLALAFTGFLLIAIVAQRRRKLPVAEVLTS